jgi:type I restriction-modification system DNA methylase subunit
LGSAYEQFLGKVIRITPSHHAKIEEKPEVRKAGGVYYTPQYIVEYIVSNTVDEKLEELKENFNHQIEPLKQDLAIAINDAEQQNISVLIKDQLLAFIENEILELSVLDPAMGSGHFLVNATTGTTQAEFSGYTLTGVSKEANFSPQLDSATVTAFLAVVAANV